VRGPAGALRLGRRTFEPHELLIVADARPGDPAAAMARVHAVVAEGADIVSVAAGPGDVVGCIVTIREAYPDLVIGVDTGRPELAREACAAGAGLLWDGGDGGVAEVAAEHGAGLVCSLAVADRAVAAGVDPARIIVDVAGGEGTWPSPEATRRVEDLAAMGWPVLVSVPGQDSPGERAAGDLAATAVCAWVGARVFRVRRVRETRRVLRMVSAIRGDIPPAAAVRGLA
jgi:dihydropteroate synthase